MAVMNFEPNDVIIEEEMLNSLTNLPEKPYIQCLIQNQYIFLNDQDSIPLRSNNFWGKLVKLKLKNEEVRNEKHILR